MRCNTHCVYITGLHDINSLGLNDNTSRRCWLKKKVYEEDDLNKYHNSSKSCLFSRSFEYIGNIKTILFLPYLIRQQVFSDRD